jgi:aminopeptidase
MAAAETRVRDYARLAVRVGLNLQPGQRVAINALVEHHPFVRAVAAEAYAAGARHVDVFYSDQHVRREHIVHAPDDTLGWSPPWLLERAEQLIADGGALLSIAGNPEPELLADLDGARVAHSRMQQLGDVLLRISDGATPWSIVAFPSDGWARAIFGEPDVERLWAAVATAVRLDEPDPVEAWRQHVAKLSARAAALNERRFDALRYRGPGTDLTVGLLRGSRWLAGVDRAHGIEFVPNMPTEEVFTVPDRRRADGIVRATYPLQIQGTIVRGLEVRFEEGVAVEIRADAGAELMRTHAATDEGAARLGEVALVDSTSRVGQTGLVFFDTLYDENAASHIALGAAILGVEGADELSDAEREAAGINVSSIHTDFMIGSNELVITGVTRDGVEAPILDRGDWVL